MSSLDNHDEQIEINRVERKQLVTISFGHPPEMLFEILFQFAFPPEVIASNGFSRHQDNVAAFNLAEFQICVAFGSGRFDGPR
jgi:hypothetical protein